MMARYFLCFHHFDSDLLFRAGQRSLIADIT
jgi:hypothetical protein